MSLTKHPTDNVDFMIWFKNQSEKYFAEIDLDKSVAGFQFQKGTKWKKGLTDQELFLFQDQLGFEFPKELIEFYRTMNGTDLPGVNVFAEQGIPYKYKPIYFSFPDHVETIKKLINDRLRIKNLTLEQMKWDKIPFIFPMCDYYFMVIDNITNPIYYISTGYRKHDLNQPVVYGFLWTDTLKSWLIKSTFFQADHMSDAEEFPERIRQPNYWTTENRATFS